MKKLILSKDLSLPLDYATSRNMVLAQSGAGKSNVTPQQQITLPIRAAQCAYSRFAMRST